MITRSFLISMSIIARRLSGVSEKRDSSALKTGIPQGTKLLVESPRVGIRGLEELFS